MKLFSIISLLSFSSAIREGPKPDVVTYGSRVSPIPERFEGEGSDRLMNSIIGKYAEEKFVNGKPTGEFSLNKNRFYDIATEVVETHVPSDNTSTWMHEYTPKAWERADVN